MAENHDVIGEEAPSLIHRTVERRDLGLEASQVHGRSRLFELQDAACLGSKAAELSHRGCPANSDQIFSDEANERLPQLTKPYEVTAHALELQLESLSGRDAKGRDGVTQGRFRSLDYELVYLSEFNQSQVVGLVDHYEHLGTTLTQPGEEVEFAG